MESMEKYNNKYIKLQVFKPNNFLISTIEIFRFFCVPSDTIFILFVSLQTLEKHSRTEIRKEKILKMMKQRKQLTFIQLLSFFTFQQFLTCCLLKYGFLFLFFKKHKIKCEICYLSQIFLTHEGKINISQHPLHSFHKRIRHFPAPFATLFLAVYVFLYFNLMLKIATISKIRRKMKVSNNKKKKTFATKKW